MLVYVCFVSDWHILQCHMTCGGVTKPHFHCLYCSEVRVEREEVQRHISDCASSRRESAHMLLEFKYCIVLYVAIHHTYQAIIALCSNISQSLRTVAKIVQRTLVLWIPMSACDIFLVLYMVANII